MVQQGHDSQKTMPWVASAEMFEIPVRHSIHFLSGSMLYRRGSDHQIHIHQTRGCGAPEHPVLQDWFGIFAHNGINDPLALLELLELLLFLAAQRKSHQPFGPMDPEIRMFWIPWQSHLYRGKTHPIWLSSLWILTEWNHHCESKNPSNQRGMHEIFQHCSLLRKPMVSQWWALQICEIPGVVCFEVSTAVEPHCPGLPTHVPPCQPLPAPSTFPPALQWFMGKYHTENPQFCDQLWNAINPHGGVTWPIKQQ